MNALEAMLARSVPVVPIVIRPAPVGRVTGWAVACPDHGALDVLAPGLAAAELVAEEHGRDEHRGRFRVVRRPEARRRG